MGDEEFVQDNDELSWLSCVLLFHAADDILLAHNAVRYQGFVPPRRA